MSSKTPGPISKLLRPIGRGCLSTLLLYGGGMSLVGAHFLTSHKSWLAENVANELVLQNFQIKDSEKKFTLVGEIHLYNNVEAEFAMRTVRDYDIVLYEGDNPNEEKTLGEKVYFNSLIPPGIVGFFCLSLASGRYLSNHTFKSAANAYEIPVLKIEDTTEGGFGVMSAADKAYIWTTVSLTGVLCPAVYLIQSINTRMDSGNIETIMQRVDEYYTPARSSTPNAVQRFKVAERDALMAKEASAYLLTRDFNSALIVVGRGHFKGMAEELSKTMELVPLNEPYVPQ